MIGAGGDVVGRRSRVSPTAIEDRGCCDDGGGGCVNSQEDQGGGRASGGWEMLAGLADEVIF